MVVFCAADNIYWNTFGKVWVKSARYHGHNNIAVHIVNPDSESFELLKELNVEYTTSEHSFDPVYFASVRFMVAKHWLHKYSSILITDIDGLFKKHVEVKNDIGIVWTNSGLDHLKIFATMLYLTKEHEKILDLFTEGYHKREKYIWFDDQRILHEHCWPYIEQFEFDNFWDLEKRKFKDMMRFYMNVKIKDMNEEIATLPYPI